MEKETVHKVCIDIGGERLDKALARLLPDLSRSRIQDLIAGGFVIAQGRGAAGDASAKVREGQVYHVTVPLPVKAEPVAQPMDIEVMFEDEHLLVINKPAGLVVHPAAGNHDGTLVNALLAHCGERLSGIGGVKRPGIVHRLDKDTSGLMVVAKSDAAHHGLSEQLAERRLSRVYQAVVWGVPAPRQGRIEGNIGRSKTNRKKMAVVSGGKPAATNYATLETFGALASLAECRLETGRTHQIRVHMTHRGHGLVGDPVYGRAGGMRSLKAFIQPKTEAAAAFIAAFPRQALHAWKIGFEHPVTGRDIALEAPLPPDMLELLRCLRKLVQVK